MEFRVTDKLSEGVRRQASTQFTFFDGLRFPEDDLMCVPHRSMMRDNRYFEKSLEFHASRSVTGYFASIKTGTQGKNLVGASAKWLVRGFWGGLVVGIDTFTG